MVSITWRNKLRISVKYLKQPFPMPLVRKCLKVASELVTGKQVWLCIFIEIQFDRAGTSDHLN